MQLRSHEIPVVAVAIVQHLCDQADVHYHHDMQEEDEDDLIEEHLSIRR